MTYNILDFGGTPDGKTLNTKVVQKAIDDIYAKGGGSLVFSKGEFVLSTVFLKSNVHIVIERDCAILGSKNFYDYAPIEKVDYELYQDCSHSYFNNSLFVGIDCENISITGEGKIDMRSVWDVDEIKPKNKKRGPKCIALKDCKDVKISGLRIYNATDLAVYFAGCKRVEISKLDLKVYIDGISPDNCDGVKIYDCNLLTGDDGIVFKSSYTLNRREDCKNIEVYNCKVSSRCNAIKFGTESNVSFKNFYIHDCIVYNTRIAGYAIESVDGAVIDNIVAKNIKMYNVNAPIFIHLGQRLRGPEGTKIGSISNVVIENFTATGEYKIYDTMPSHYERFVRKSYTQDPKKYDDFTYEDVWQLTSNICGLKDYPLKNITLKNVFLEVDGGVTECNREVPEQPLVDYPEVYVYGKFLPASGLYLRHIDGLTIENFAVKTLRTDCREPLAYDDVILN